MTLCARFHALARSHFGLGASGLATLPRHTRVRPSVDTERLVIRRLFFGAFLLRFGLGLTGWVLTQEGRIPFIEDPIYYNELGHLIAQDWLAGHSSAWLSWAMVHSREPWLLPAVVAGFYWLSGGVQVMPLLLAVYCSITAWTPVVVYCISRRLGVSGPGAQFAGRLVAFSPAFAFWSGALYKEGLIFLFLSTAILQILQLQIEWRLRSLLLASGCLAGLFGLRFYVAVLMSGVLCLGLILGRRRDPGQEFLFVVVRQVSVLAVFITTLAALGLTGHIHKLIPSDLDTAVRTIETARLGSSLEGASGFNRNVRITSPSEAIRYLPVGVGYFLFSPTPWQFGHVRQNLAIPETVFWISLYPLAAWGALRGLRRNFQGSILLLVPATLLTSIYALGSGNIGTLFRMRVQVWLILSIFAGWGWEALRERQRRSRSIKAAVRRCPAA
jgi:hypothetical protein